MQPRSLRCVALIIPAATMLLITCSAKVADVDSRLAEWRKGVWITGSGTYTIYTDTHYFVLSYEGDSTSANIYCGASQVKFCNKGMARKQVIRLRQVPGGEMRSFKDLVLQPDHTEAPLIIDTTLFTPGVCNIDQGIIYDSITEAADDYILLATCNGDQEKIYSNGVSVYLPSGGGEFYSYRIEEL